VGSCASSIPTLGAEIRTVLRRADDYKDAGKPVCDWEDAAAREALVDALAHDGFAALSVLEVESLRRRSRSGGLLATVLGQDLERLDNGRSASPACGPDRVISTVDPEARHGHKTQSRHFDGYKGHVAIDPTRRSSRRRKSQRAMSATARSRDARRRGARGSEEADADEPVEIYGDASYGTADLVEKIEAAGAEANVKVQAASPPRVGLYSQDAFKSTHRRAPPAALRAMSSGFVSCRTEPGRRFFCVVHILPLRTPVHHVRIGARAADPSQARDARALARPATRPRLEAALPATRPKVERKIGHLDATQARRQARAHARLREDSLATSPCSPPPPTSQRLAVLGVV